jgi:SAM-dependent methyltransferase
MALDATKTVDLIKLRFYLDWMYNNHIYAEGESGYHKQLTTQIVKDYVDPLNLPLDAKIVDLGCGPGYFLDEMKERGYTNIVGATLSEEDIKLCESKGHTVHAYDLSFLPSNEGYVDESVDFIFLRHALEHSPFPIISLIEYNRVLKKGGRLYIEVPAPDCDRQHEFNSNHYSIMGQRQLVALLQRTGFELNALNTISFDLTVGQNDDGTPKVAKEVFYCIMATRVRGLDIK